MTLATRLSLPLAVAASLVTTVVIAGCGDLDHPTRPADVAHDGTSASPPGTGFPVGPELAAVRAATATFHDISAAYAAGYSTQFEPCVALPGVGVMGIHAINQPLMGDQHVDPLRPEALLYVPTANGGHRLTGVEYFEVVLVRNPATNEVAPWVSPDPWPASYEVVTPTPHLFGRAFDGPMPGHIPTMPWHWDMHVWIWAHNPDGMFAEWNPSLQCGE